MWTHFLDILWNSDKIWWSANRRENCKLLTMLFEILWKNAKIRDENFLKYWGLSGAKACKSCRSRQELSNEYLLAKIGFDTAENEPFNFHNFSSLQGFNFHGAVVSQLAGARRHFRVFARATLESLISSSCARDPLFSWRVEETGSIFFSDCRPFFFDLFSAFSSCRLYFLLYYFVWLVAGFKFDFLLSVSTVGLSWIIQFLIHAASLKTRILQPGLLNWTEPNSTRIFARQCISELCNMYFISLNTPLSL